MIKLKPTQIFASVLVLISVVTAGFVLYNRSISKNLSDYTCNTINEIMLQQRHSFISLVNERTFIIKSLSKVIADSVIYTDEADTETVSKIINDATVDSEFKSILLADLNGIIIGKDNKVYDVSKNDFFTHALSGETYLSEPFLSPSENIDYVAFSTPVYVDNEIRSILIGIYDADKLGSAFITSYESSGLTYVLNKDGEIITSSIDNGLSLSNLSDLSEAKIISFDDINSITNNIPLNLKGHSKFEYKGQKWVLHYSPLNINGWYIFSFVQEDVISKEANTISLYTLYLTAFTILTFILILTYIALSHKKQSEMLFKTTYFDKMTGVPNLDKFKLDAADVLKKNKHLKFYFMIFDIHRFKMINEMYGIETGNEVIISITEILKKMANKNSFCFARINADEFVFLDSYKNTDELNENIKHFQNALSSLELIAGNHKIEYRFGRYIIENNENNVELILENTNLAHSIAKTQKTKTLCDYDDAVKQKLIKEAELENEMEKAIENNEFFVYLQPKYKLDTEDIAGAEALVRWIRNGEFIASPGEFIPLFERNGFILKLDMYMLDKVCQIIKGWMDENKPLVTISINFSRLHLLEVDFVKKIEDIVNSYKIPKKYIEIELTESTMFNNENILQNILTQLHTAGFTLSMDDFGTGYSSLGLLKNLPVDVIKIDRAFFVDNKYKTRAKTVIKSIMEMAKNLDIHTVAEGVENKEHIDFLKEVGCDIVQGYYYAKPLPAENFSVGKAVYGLKSSELGEVLDYFEIGNIALGRETIGKDMPVAVYRLYQLAIRRMLIETYGDGEMIKLLQNAGTLAGRAFARELLSLDLPFDEFVKELTNKLLEMKIGLLSIESFDKNTGVGVFVIKEDLDCSGMPILNRTFCHYDEGFIAGILNEYTKTIYSVTEEECWGTGAKHCKFTVKPK